MLLTSGSEVCGSTSTSAEQSTMLADQVGSWKQRQPCGHFMSQSQA